MEWIHRLCFFIAALVLSVALLILKEKKEKCLKGACPPRRLLYYIGNELPPIIESATALSDILYGH